MTLGSQGGRVRPLTRTELLDLAEASPTTNLVMLGRALGISEPVIRERARRGELAAMGIRVLRLGAQWRVVTEDILTFLGISRDAAVDAAVPPRRDGDVPGLRVLRRGGDDDEAA